MKPTRLFGLLLLLLMAAGTTRAATITSNAANAADSASWTINSNAWVGQGFTTDAQKYQLDSVTLAGLYGSGDSPVTIELWDEQAGLPGTAIALLDQQTGTVGDVTFASSTDVILEPSTTYFVVASYWGTGSYAWRRTLDLTEDGPGSVTNMIASSEDQGSSWISFSNFPPARLTITGNSVPEPSSMLIALGSLMAGVAMLRRR